MASFDVLHHALNVGVIDANKLHRVDLERMRLGAETQTNLIPTTVGPAFFRPGFEFLKATKGSARAYLLPFIAGGDDAYVLELTDSFLKVWDPDTAQPISRPTVASSITNGTFASSTGWTLASTSGQSSTIAGNELKLTATAKGGKAIGKQTVATTSGGILHALRILISVGPVVFRCGSTDGDDDLVAETELHTGWHSLAFVPAGSNFYIQFSNTRRMQKKVASVGVEAAGDMQLPTPWVLAKLPLVRIDQSVDVAYCACEGVRRQMIERRGNGAAEGLSWSVVDYNPDDGQFLVAPSASITLTPSAIEGNTTLTASEPFFKSTHVGALFRLVHRGQRVTQKLSAAKRYTDPIMISGVNEPDYNERDFTTTITGTWVGTLRTQRSFDGEDIEFHDFRRETGSSTIDITGNAAFTNDDNEDNAIEWVRVGFDSYTSGEATVDLVYDGGQGEGICRVTAFTDSQHVAVEVLKPFKGTHATADWQEGEWSDAQSQPAAVVFHEGRLFWFGEDRIAGSISDAYDSFDETFEGDAGPIVRAIAIGGRNQARWGLSASTLFVGCDARVAQIMASSLGEIITPDNTGVKRAGQVGVAKIAPAFVGVDRALFVERAGTSIYELSYSAEDAQYLSTEFSKLTTDILASGVEGMAVQIRPDQRIWMPTTDGDCVLCLFEPVHKVAAFVPIALSEGDVIESVCVVPAEEQDRVFASIRRSVNGSTVRYVERLALDREAMPATLCKCVDSFVTFSAAQLVTGLTHLVGRTVVAWADGAPVVDDDGVVREFEVDSDGQVLLPDRVDSGVIGLAYQGRYKSARLEYGANGMTTLDRRKSVTKAGFLLADYVRDGIRFGQKFSDLASMPLMGPNGARATNVVSGVPEDEDAATITGEIKLDARLCFEVNSPNPATIRAIIMGIATS